MSQSAHPAPHRHNINFALLTAALIGTPAVWGARLVVNYAIDSHFCFPGDRRSNAIPGWTWPTLIGLDLFGDPCGRGSLADLAGQLAPDPARTRGGGRSPNRDWRRTHAIPVPVGSHDQRWFFGRADRRSHYTLDNAGMWIIHRGLPPSQKRPPRGAKRRGVRDVFSAFRLL